MKLTPYQIAFIVLAILFVLILIAGGVYYYKKRQPVNPTPRPSVTGTDTFDITYLKPEDFNDDQYVIRDFAKIAPPYLYKLSWNITKPTVPTGTNYRINVKVVSIGDEPINLEYETKDNFIFVNPLDFAKNGKSSYTFTTSITFTIKDKRYIYEPVFSNDTLSIPYLITDVGSPYPTPNSGRVNNAWMINKPIYPYGNAFFTPFPNDNLTILGPLALYATNTSPSRTTPGFITQVATLKSVKPEQPAREVPLSIPILGIQGDITQENWVALQTYQNTYKNVAMIRIPDRVLRIPLDDNKGVFVSLILNNRFGGNNSGYTRIINTNPINLGYRP